MVSAVIVQKFKKTIFYEGLI